MGKVLAIKTNDLFPHGVKSGFFKIGRNDKILQVIKNKALFLERSALEDDDNFQQLIVQIVLKVKDKIFIHKITQKGSEDRLYNMYPIFLGGHVDETDLSIEKAADREFEEEIKYFGKILVKSFQGMIKLHDNKVNRVHTGLVWIYEGDILTWEHRDENLIDGRFVTIAELDKFKDKMTYWSKLYLPELLKIFKNNT